MATLLDAQKPATADALGQVPPYCQTFHAAYPQRTPVPGGTLPCVTHLRQEPYAEIPHVRICAGGEGLTFVPTATSKDAPTCGKYPMQCLFAGSMPFRVELALEPKL